MPIDQWIGNHSTAMVVRAKKGKSDAALLGVRSALQALAPDIPFPRINSYAELMDPQFRAWKLGASMFTLFGVLAFIVAIVGLYGLLAYSVAQRRYEFRHSRRGRGSVGGHRVARRRRALVLVGAGLTLGIATAVGASKWVGPMLFDVAPTDLAVYAAIGAAVLAATAIAAAVPARRASRIPPSLALRSE